jgi:hypothetical protein
MVVNFRARVISRGACKLARILTLKKNKFFYKKINNITISINNYKTPPKQLADIPIDFSELGQFHIVQILFF